MPLAGLLCLIKQTLVMIVDRYAEVALGLVLTDHVIVQKGLHAGRLPELLAREGQAGTLRALHLRQHLMAALQAVRTDMGAVGTAEEGLGIVARSAAEGAVLHRIRIVVTVFSVCHRSGISRLVSTSSIRPYSLASADESQ